MTAGLPDDRALGAGIESILGPGTTVVSRSPALYTSTFPSEVLACRRNGHALRLFSKYEAGRSHSSNGHRGGVPHEARVYRELLTPLGLSTPHFFGALESRETGDTWLVLEHIAGVRVSKARDEGALPLAAEWAARLHARTEGYSRDFPRRYDASYYVLWSERTLRFAEPSSRRELHWLSDLCEGFEAVARELADARPSLVHGEYCTSNVLFSDGRIAPVDWESCAVAPGEIDLAMLTDKWPQDDVRRCVTAYVEARWQGDAPADFARTLSIARLYVHFRWLGNRRKWTQEPKARPRFEEIRALGVSLGLIPPP